MSNTIADDADFSLRDLQDLNRRLYGVSDDRKYSFSDILSYIHRHVTQILKNVRKNDHKYTKYHLCSAFSWVMAYANRMHVDVTEEMWACFPGKCPYCTEKPCTCKQRGISRSNSLDTGACPSILNVNEFQQTLAEIYPDNTLLNSSIHLAEEIGELSEASRNYHRFSDEARFSKVVEEIIDVFAHIFAVSTDMGFRLGSVLSCYFSGGLCPKCKKCPCGCAYVEFDTPIEID